MDFFTELAIATAYRVLSDAIDPTTHRLYNLGQYLSWSPGDKNAVLDGEFNADELEAIAWWMRNH